MGVAFGSGNWGLLGFEAGLRVFSERVMRGRGCHGRGDSISSLEMGDPLGGVKGYEMCFEASRQVLQESKDPCPFPIFNFLGIPSIDCKLVTEI
jgi:hypothetical protein